MLKLIVMSAPYNCRIYNKALPQVTRSVKQRGSNCGCYLFLLPKQTVTRSAQCHISVQLQPHRRPNNKYPAKTSHRSDLCKNASLLCYLVATVIHIQSVRCQICVYIYTCCSAQYGEAGRAKGITKTGTTVNAASEGNLSKSHFEFARHGNSYTVCTVSDVCVYTHVVRHNMETLVGQKE